MNKIYGYRVEWYNNIDDKLDVNCGLVCAESIADATRTVENKMFDENSIEEITIFTLENNGCGCVLWEDMADLVQQFNEENYS